ncbi:MAG: DUF4442 domain-containing protein [Thermoanaerobaculia bacterium]
MIFRARPAIVHFDDTKTVVRIRLRRKTRNHQRAMYIGALVIGADVASGLAAMRAIERSGGGVSLIFTDIHGEFFKRAEADVLFTCEEGAAIRELVGRAVSTGEREEMPVHVTVTVPSRLGDEPVARFTLTLSLRRKERR